MNLILQAFIVYLCFASISCEWNAPENKTQIRKAHAADKKTEKSLLIAKLQSIMKSKNEAMPIEKKTNETSENTHERTKRQVPKAYGAAMGGGWGIYDYNDYYGGYLSDYSYDYYDWVCSDTSCQLCDILTSECCDPRYDVNCYLPDSCLNNPCLGGGTCITMKTLDGYPDFTCVCLPGLTGKYCQLPNDYLIGADLIAPLVVPGPMPPVAPIPPPMGGPNYGGFGGAAPGYGQQAGPGFGQQAGPGFGQQAGPGYGQQVAPAYGQQVAPAYGQQTGPTFNQQAGPAYGQQPVAPDASYAPQPQPQPDVYQQQQPQPQPSYGQDVQAQPQPTGAGPYGGAIRPMSAKRVKCGTGQIFNYEKNACTDFTLKRKVSN